MFAGLAEAFAFCGFDQPLSATIGWMFGITIHAVGYGRLPRGSAQAITLRRSSRYLKSLGGTVQTSSRVDAAAIQSARSRAAISCFSTPRRSNCWLRLRAIGLVAANTRSDALEQFKARLRRIQGGLRTFAACSVARGRPAGGQSPFMWADRLRKLRRRKMRPGNANGREAERPFSCWWRSRKRLYDTSRAPEGKHVLWACCHVPNGSTFDMTERIEAQIERFAPGFRDCVLASYVSSLDGTGSDGCESCGRRH